MSNICRSNFETWKEYCCFDHSDFPAYSIFTFDVCWGSLGTRIFGKSSSDASNTRSRLPSRLSFRFLWLWLNLPVKSIYPSSTVSKPRELAFKRTEKKIKAVTPSILSVRYNSYEEFVKRVLNLKLSSEWNIQQKDNLVYFTKSDSQHMVPLYEIFIGESLRF